jgi:hypothetical protein
MVGGMTFSETSARWVSATCFEDLPADVVAATRFRVLDVMGLALAGAGNELLDKFHDNAASFLLPDERHALAELVLKLEELPDASTLVSLAASSTNPQ